MVTGGSCGARPPSCSVVRVAPAGRCGFAGAGPAAVALTVSPFLLWVGAPPRPWGGGGPRLWLPSWGGCGGGGGGAAPPPALGPVWEGGGGGWGGAFGPLAIPPVGQKGGGGRLGGPGPGGQPSARGVAPFPRPPLPRAGFSRKPSSGAPHPPAVVARRWPAGGGREGQRSVVSGLRGSRFPPALVVSALPPAGGGAPLSLGRQQSGRHWCRAVHGGRGHPYHSGSRPPGFSGHDLRGVPVRRRGPTCSSRPPFEPAAGAWGQVTLRLPSRAGGGPSLLPQGVGAGAPVAGGRVGGRGGGVSRRVLPALVPGGGLWYSFLALSVSPARSLPARACGRGCSAAPGWGG